MPDLVEIGLTDLPKVPPPCKMYRNDAFNYYIRVCLAMKSASEFFQKAFVYATEQVKVFLAPTTPAFCTCILCLHLLTFYVRIVLKSL